LGVTRITTQDVKDGSVNTIDLADGAVTFAKLTVATDPGLEDSTGIRVKIADNSLARTGGLAVQRHAGIGLDATGIFLQELNGATAGTGNDGAVWYDTADKQVKTQLAGQIYSEVGVLLLDPGNGTSIVSSAAENDVDSTKRLTVAGNFLKTNRVIRIRQVFRYSCTGTPTITARIRVVGAGNDIVLTCTSTALNNASNLYGIFEAVVVCSTGGSTASVRCHGRLDLGGASASVSATSGTSVDVTASTTIKPTYQWSASSASNTLRPELITYEVLN
jgi:hypothetical protein